MIKRNKINLIARLRDDPAREAAAGRRLKLFAPLAILILAVLGGQLFYAFSVLAGLEAQRDTLAAYVGDPAVTAAYNDALWYTDARDALAGRTTALGGVAENLDSYPSYNSERYRQIYRAALGCGARVDSLSFDRESGLLVIEGTGPQPAVAADFVVELRRADMNLGSASCDGYRETEEGYAFIVTVWVIQLKQ